MLPASGPGAGIRTGRERHVDAALVSLAFDREPCAVEVGTEVCERASRWQAEEALKREPVVVRDGVGVDALERELGLRRAGERGPSRARVLAVALAVAVRVRQAG